MASQEGGPTSSWSSSFNPVPAYLATTSSSPLKVDTALYSKIASAPRTQTYTHTVPPRSGHAWHAPAGSIVRIATPEGPQVGDLNIWAADNARERFWASRSKQLHRAHVSVGDRLWSCLPYLRPMVTIVADTLEGYGRDPQSGAGVHDLLGTRCDPYVNKLLTGEDFDFHCHSNLTRAVLPFGLDETDVHDVINLFQATGLNRDDKYFMLTCPAKPGDYIEFFAEIDVLMALSTCPGGDLSQWGFGGDNAKSMEECCRPLKVEVFELKDREEVLKGWESPKRPAYRGLHGLRQPEKGAEWAAGRKE